MFKVNDKTFDKEIEVIEVAIGKKTYEVPLAKYLPYKQLKKLKDKRRCYEQYRKNYSQLLLY